MLSPRQPSSTCTWLGVAAGELAACMIPAVTDSSRLTSARAILTCWCSEFPIASRNASVLRQPAGLSGRSRHASNCRAGVIERENPCYQLATLCCAAVSLHCDVLRDVTQPTIYARIGSYIKNVFL